MGSAHILITKEVYNIVVNKYYDVVNILEHSLFGEGVMILKVESDLLGDGYQGQQTVIIENDSIRFKKDCDV